MYINDHMTGKIVIIFTKDNNFPVIMREKRSKGYSESTYSRVSMESPRSY